MLELQSCALGLVDILYDQKRSKVKKNKTGDWSKSWSICFQNANLNRVVHLHH